jgi:DNA-binding NarL/FixJ family response regulator
LGQPVVPNGIPLSKIHHAAFDAHLIGIDPDYRLHVSERLLLQNDGHMLEALKRLHGGTIYLPSRVRDRPDRDRLALRFARFKATAQQANGEGRKLAMRNGVKMGPRFKLTPYQREVAAKRMSSGDSTRQIARDFNVSHNTIARLR